jgi:hypothetical protein
MADDRPQDERFLDLRDHEAALAYLRTCRGDTDSGIQMRGLLADEDAPASLSEWDDDQVLDALAHRLERVDLTLLRPRREYRSDELVIMPEQDEDEPVLAAAPELTWIEIQLVDEVGEPVAGQAYELTMPDGSVQQGKLNYRGRARVDDIGRPGACTVKFPDLDADAWERI